MSAWRMQFFTIAIVIFIGIWLTGFETVHWFLYVPVVLLALAGITGTCIGLQVWKKLGFRE